MDAVHEGAAGPLTRLLDESRDAEVRKLSCHALASLAQVRWATLRTCLPTYGCRDPARLRGRERCRCRPHTPHPTKLWRSSPASTQRQAGHNWEPMPMVTYMGTDECQCVPAPHRSWPAGRLWSQ